MADVAIGSPDCRGPNRGQGELVAAIAVGSGRDLRKADLTTGQSLMPQFVGHVAVEAAFEIADKNVRAHLALDNAPQWCVKEFIPDPS